MTINWYRKFAHFWPLVRTYRPLLTRKFERFEECHRAVEKMAGDEHLYGTCVWLASEIIERLKYFFERAFSRKKKKKLPSHITLHSVINSSGIQTHFSKPHLLCLLLPTVWLCSYSLGTRNSKGDSWSDHFARPENQQYFNPSTVVTLADCGSQKVTLFLM